MKLSPCGCPLHSLPQRRKCLVQPGSFPALSMLTEKIVPGSRVGNIAQFMFNKYTKNLAASKFDENEACLCPYTVVRAQGGGLGRKKAREKLCIMGSGVHDTGSEEPGTGDPWPSARVWPVEVLLIQGGLPVHVELRPTWPGPCKSGQPSVVQGQGHQYWWGRK